MSALEPALSNVSLSLLAGADGWSVVDPSTVLTRLWYFDGKLLRAEGFRREQEYVRSLVAVSNQAIGHGVVHGLTAERGEGDTIRVDPGLALAPSGRPLLLTTQQDLPIAELVARASRSGVGADSGAFRPDAGFSPCPPDAGPDEPSSAAAPSTMWVLYAALAEALCGEEERFGKLCEDACDAEADRSYVVEGVRFFVEPLELELPTSSAVSFTARHLRSRYASAYFRWARTRTPSLISGAGLRSGVWCRGAQGVDGPAVPLAVFDRAGGVTSFVDAWTARRELMEASPERYWRFRTGTRPRDAFLAEVLQFQCQLLGTGGGGVGGQPDDCADEREALAATGTLLDRLAGRLGPQLDDDGGEAVALLSERAPTEAIADLAALRIRVADVLRRGGGSRSGSQLLDAGFAELPPAGYLWVTPTAPLRPQLESLLGPGVDLRLCAVRPDFIGEALDEAQHLDRISLTRGIDDPGAVEEVDVLVPDGRVETAAAEAASVYEGQLRLYPTTIVDDNGLSQLGAPLALRAVAREHRDEAWSWSLAAFGEAGGNIPVTRLLRGALADLGFGAAIHGVEAVGAVGEEELAVEVPFVSEETLEQRLADPALLHHARRERYYARERRSRIRSLFAEAEGVGEAVHAISVGPDRKLGRSENRPLAVWFDVHLARPVDELSRGESVTVTGRLSLYSRAKEEPVLADVRLSGTLVVTGAVSGAGTGAVLGGTTVFTTLRGHVDPLVVVGSNTLDRAPVAVDGVELRWQTGRRPEGGTALLLRAGSKARVGASFVAERGGDPQRVHATVQRQTRTQHVLVGDAATSGAGAEIVATKLVESSGGLAEGSDARDVAETAIESIGAELSLPDRDPSFTATARRRMFGDVGSRDTTTIAATADWVFFHRRRVKRCEAEGGRQPTPTRSYRWFHATVDDRGAVKELLARLEGVVARTADELPGFEAPEAREDVRRRSDLDYVRAYLPALDLGFEPLATADFQGGTSRLQTPAAALRAAWSAAPRGGRLLLAAGGDVGPGDGEDVLLGRISALRSTLTGLVDQRATDVHVLGAVPPEFVTAGLDGSLFTIGLEEPDVEAEGCMTLLQVDDRGFGLLVKEATSNDTATLGGLLALAAEAGVSVERHRVDFGPGPAALNGVDTEHWWGPIPPAVGLLLLPTGLTDAQTETRVARAAAVRELLAGPSQLGPPVLVRDAGDCGAVMVLRRITQQEPGASPEFFAIR